MSNGHEVGRCFWAQGKEAGYGLVFIAFAEAIGDFCKSQCGRSANAVHTVDQKRAFTALAHEDESFFDLLASCDGIAMAGIIAIFEGEDELGPVIHAQLLAFAGILAGQDSIPPTLLASGLGKASHSDGAWSRKR